MHWWISYSFISIALLLLFSFEKSTIVIIILLKKYSFLHTSFFLSWRLCNFLPQNDLSSFPKVNTFIIAEQYRRRNSEIPHRRSYIQRCVRLQFVSMSQFASKKHHNIPTEALKQFCLSTTGTGWRVLRGKAKGCIYFAFKDIRSDSKPI